MDPKFLEVFDKLKVILCMCPECNTISRLSDLHIRAAGKAPKTWLDDYKLNVKNIDSQEEKFEEEKQKIKELAIERGRAQVPKLVRKAMDERIAKLEYDPYDIKAILHPIDFVVFDGMNNDNIKNIVLLSRTNQSLQVLHQGIAQTVKDKAYDWKIVRVSDDGRVEYE